MTNSSDDRDPVERLAEEFLERRRRGETPPLTEYVDRHPEWAEEIRAVFPALVMMEQLKPAAGDVTGSYIGADRADPNRVPERLADFRILREVGRGGMGIVFEAEQESLGRHVALKVLPSHALLNPRHLQRFLREARSAARLHHTNIVPVFGVGHSDGLHYYVMQFITGPGLDQVIDELRRLKAVARPDTGSDGSPAHPTKTLHEVTRGLLTGQFAATPTAEATDESAQGSESQAPLATPGAVIVGSGSSILSGSGRGFAKAVARVGLRVAEALNYAHGQGVLHRDIKPSNLLLDVQGTLWVTDFGLAKASADSGNLTQEGDVLGTLRYMAPERFRGKSDARSDVYALGLTLYELLTLRPAFDQGDRDRLIHQVTTEQPPRPRLLNAEIPRDLETIVLKAIEHEPTRRYQHAEDLATDLERFLADRPIKARPVGALERAGKWARRKPTVAGLLAALAMALVVGFAGITWQWREAVAARNLALANERKARTNFEHALETVNTFCTQVSQEQLLDEPGMQPLRRRLLELARQYYQKFQREQGSEPARMSERAGDPRLMGELAQSFMRSGIIAGELGDAAESFQALLRAKDILVVLCRAEPKDARLKTQLVQCYIEMEDADQSIEANQAGTDAKVTHPSVELMEPLVAGDQQCLQYIRLLGRSYDAYGIREFRKGLYQSSTDALKKAVNTLDRVCHAAPEDGEAARWLALAYSDLAMVDQQTGVHAERIWSLGQALKTLKELEARAPKSRRHRLDIARCLVQLGDVRMEMGQYQRAEAFLRDAEDRLMRFAPGDREAADVQYWLAVAKQQLGRLALARGRITDAARSLYEALTSHKHASEGSRAERDQLALAASYLWLVRVAFQSGRLREIPAMRHELVKSVEAFQRQLLVGVPLRHQSRIIMQVEGLSEALFLGARATTSAERITALRREVQVQESVAGEQPDNPALQFEVAWSCVRLAELSEREGQVDEARSSLETTLPVLKNLAKAEPENLRWRQGLARARETLGRVQARSGQAAEAKEAADQAVAIAEELARNDSAYLYDLACVLSLRGELRSSEADLCAAVAAVRRAIAAGFDNTYLLRTDPRLDAMRSRADFQAAVGQGSS
jgi:serine/threonine-protein kinase